jgi:hypothetical protein
MSFIETSSAYNKVEAPHKKAQNSGLIDQEFGCVRAYRKNKRGTVGGAGRGG